MEFDYSAIVAPPERRVREPHGETVVRDQLSKQGRLKPLVTIGIPTFNRARMLERALKSVAEQDYPNLDVLVADNASPGDDTRRVVDSFKHSIRNLSYTRHDRNIGALNNFAFLLGIAEGQYFMWLADDDEISPNYVSELVGILEEDRSVPAAAGNWILMQNEREGRVMRTSSFPQRSVFARVLRFVWHTDDAFFYGLFRTSVLRQASFSGYCWPNREVLSNWAYVYLLDVVLTGRVVRAENPSVRFINHDYTQKFDSGSGRLLVSTANHVCRRINVHFLYWKKSAKVLSPLMLPSVVLTSVLSLIREAGVGAIRLAVRNLRRLGAFGRARDRRAF